MGPSQCHEKQTSNTSRVTLCHLSFQVWKCRPLRIRHVTPRQCRAISQARKHGSTAPGQQGAVLQGP